MLTTRNRFFNRNPFHAVFGFTLLGLMTIVNAVTGLQITRRLSFVNQGPLLDGPRWVQVGIGVGFLFAAALFYRLASRDPRLRAED